MAKASAEVNCETCGKVFLALNKDLKRGRGRFCSRSCSSSRKRGVTLVVVICSYCGLEVKKRPCSLRNSKSGMYFCNRKCKESAQKLGGLEEIQPSHYGTAYSKFSYRKVALRELENVCNRCGYKDVPAILQVHHVDRNRENNSVDNLEILCPNCHAIEHYVKGD